MKITLSAHKILCLGCVYVLVVALFAIQTTKISGSLGDDDVAFGLIDSKVEWKLAKTKDNGENNSRAASRDSPPLLVRPNENHQSKEKVVPVMASPQTLLEANQKKQLRAKTLNSKDMEDNDIGSPRGFGLCLLIKDDNDILPEWIAYHYHALELRQLIVAIDPSSKILPNSILERFQQELPDLSVQIWEDKDFMPPSFLAGNYSGIPNFIGDANSTHSEWHSPTSEHFQNESTADMWLTSINNHRYRQVRFVGECIRHLYPKTTTDDGKAIRWMAHIDTDEFIVINPKMFTADRDRYKQVEMNETAAAAAATLRDVVGGQPNLGDNLNDRRPWKTLAASSVLRFLEQWLVQYPIGIRSCVQIPRLLFGAKEEEGIVGSDDAAVHNFLNAKRGAPSTTKKNLGPFHVHNFETLRWKWHARFGGIVNGFSKVLMDLTQLNPRTDLILRPRRRAVSVHRLSFELCPPTPNYQLWDKRPVASNHYLGSEERYLSKGDPRRSATNHAKKSMAASKGIDPESIQWLYQWLPQMIEDHGLEKMKRLLLPEYTTTQLS